MIFFYPHGSQVKRSWETISTSPVHWRYRWLPSWTPYLATFYIPLYKLSDHFQDVKDSRTIFRILIISIKAYDWIKQFDHEGCSLLWCKCPFLGHYLWRTTCDNKSCKGYDVQHTQFEYNPQVLMLFLSRSSHINVFLLNHHSAEDNLSCALNFQMVSYQLYIWTDQNQKTPISPKTLAWNSIMRYVSTSHLTILLT